MFSYPDGRKDVGLWLGERLLRFCSSVEESFSLKNFPEYAAYVDLAAITHSLTQVHGRALSYTLMNSYPRIKHQFHTYIWFRLVYFFFLCEISASTMGDPVNNIGNFSPSMMAQNHLIKTYSHYTFLFFQYY